MTDSSAGPRPSESHADDPIAAVWAHVQQARNLKRPHTLELVKVMADEFIELHGDRLFGDDSAIVAGLARIAGRRVVVIGFQKGQDTEENIRRNFGLPHPEGYRKAMRVMDLAERFAMPVLTFVDVQGAFPGAAAEERGIAEAIAKSVGLMTRLRTPIVVVITGEGGSGGALGLAVGDASSPWRTRSTRSSAPKAAPRSCGAPASRASQAAMAMKVTAGEQQELGIVDVVIPEPGEGAHTDPGRDGPADQGNRYRAVRRPRPHPARRAGRGPLQEVPGLWARTSSPTGRRAPPERAGIADRLRGLLSNMPSMPSLPGTRRDAPPGREEV